MELSAVHVLARLTNKHMQCLTFIDNRCLDIHTLVPIAIWHHLSLSKSSPDDLASRGCSPSTMINREL
ncbi:hypothetical protein J437_LFUL003700 [Ladona fulva]|uniref:Uncharacterized protein n=1 Tax=Ladona fulva TaxID=123851 RepID=A0A8K0JX79_LADFU|nr:hypothetical protein J437_LFUL003700 [Ladona fulva]